jgi:hypothetical protein
VIQERLQQEQPNPEQDHGQGSEERHVFMPRPPPYKQSQQQKGDPGGKQGQERKKPDVDNNPACVDTAQLILSVVPGNQ